MPWSKEKRRAYKKAWDKANKEHINEYARKWRQANPESVKEHNQQYREWKLANPELNKKRERKARLARKKKVNSDFDVFVQHKWSSQRGGAKKRGLSWSLTKEQVYTLFKTEKRCALTGLRVTHKIGDPFQASIDRIDNRYGYSLKNVQIVSARANSSRMALTIKEWDKLCVSRAKQLGYTK